MPKGVYSRKPGRKFGPRRKIDPLWRFLKFAKIGDGDLCWVWEGSRREGYSQMHSAGRPVAAHKWAYERFIGPVPAGLQLYHSCLNRGCVNPYHLEPLPPREITKRGKTPELSRARNLTKTHCPKGHPYSGDNLVTRKSGKNRQCSQCRRDQWRAQNRQRHTQAEIDRIVAQQRGRCWWCGKKLPAKYHVDHRIPVSKGGSRDLNNLVAACIPCNLSKHARMPWEFAGRLL
jgi:5-methylcytosine-specific restriction endonuclease McrA